MAAERDIFNMPVKRKGQINSKQKGNRNELDCARPLKVWVGEEFYRVPASGGFRREKQIEGMVGDLTCSNAALYFPFTLETKHLKELDKSKIKTIWKQALADGIRSGKLPLALLRYNRHPKFKHNGAEYIDYHVVVDAVYGGGLISYKIKPIDSIHSDRHGYTLFVFKFSDIIRNVPFPVLCKSIQSIGLVEKFIKAHETSNT